MKKFQHKESKEILIALDDIQAAAIEQHGEFEVVEDDKKKK